MKYSDERREAILKKLLPPHNHTVAHHELPQGHARGRHRSATVKPMAKALTTLERHAEQVVRRWTSSLTNARLEDMNGLFQAARSRARGY